MDEIREKECIKCFQVISIDMFRIHPQSGNYDNICSDCKKGMAKGRYEKNKEKRLAYSRQYKKDNPEKIKNLNVGWRKNNKDKARAYTRRWRKNNKEKSYAHTRVHEAIKDGRLVKPCKCSKCDSTERIQGHHEDYSKPLEVIWLCESCHVALHKGRSIDECRISA